MPDCGRANVKGTQTVNAQEIALVNALNAAAVNLEDAALRAASRRPLLGKALRTQAQELRDTALVIEEEAQVKTCVCGHKLNDAGYCTSPDSNSNAN